MSVLNSLITAFSTYSRIPMPSIEWDEKNSRYALCFFPLIGAVIGILMFLASYVCGLLEFGGTFRAAVVTVIPILVTGGIHMDGYLDTTDALSSYAPKEKKLVILKDPNTGAFAVIYSCVWFLLYFASVFQIQDGIVFLALGFMLSRSLSALAFVTFKSARDTGMGADLQKRTQKHTIIIFMILYIVFTAGIMVYLNALYAGMCILSAALAFTYYRIKSYKEFGGFTGDIAGWFLQICELAICLSLAVSERIYTLWF